MQLSDLDRKIGVLVYRIVETESRPVRGALESKLEELEREKLVLKKIRPQSVPLQGYDESFRTAMSFLASPWNLWDPDSLEDKRAVLKLTFPRHLRHNRVEGFRTPET